MYKFTRLLSILFLFFNLSSVQAASVYTSQADYLSALSSVVTTTYDFDSISAGTVIGNNTSITSDGVDATFNYNIIDGGIAYTMQVQDQFDATSGENYLGLTAGGSNASFVGGDEFTINFSETIYAAGLYLLSGSTILADDFTLSTNSGQSVNNIATADAMLADGSMAYYIGLIENDTNLGFNSITLSSAAFGFSFDVDDITISSLTPFPTVNAVPLPAAAWLFGSGILFLIGFGRARSGKG